MVRKSESRPIVAWRSISDPARFAALADVLFELINRIEQGKETGGERAKGVGTTKTA